MKNSIFIKGASLALGCIMMTGTLFAKEKPITLVVSDFMPGGSATNKDLIMPWAKAIEKASKGRIKIRLFPSMTLGGKPGELYTQVRDGTADIVWTLAGYTPGVFPRTEVYELPTVHRGDALATTLAIRKNFDLIKADYKAVHPLLVYVAAGNSIHTVDKKITSVADLKGLKMRTPSRTGAWYISDLGGVPVGMPLPALPQALSKHALDGAFVPFEVFPDYKLFQLTQYSTLGPKNERFGTSVFLFLMNKDKYNSLPKDLQKIIDDNSGLEFAKRAGQIWMDVEKPGMKLQRESKGSEVINLTPEAMKEFDAVGQKVVDRWIKEADKKGIDGKKLVDSARKAITEFSK